MNWNKILLVSAGYRHPSLMTRYHLRRMIRHLDNYIATPVRSIESLHLLPFDEIAAVVLLVHQNTVSAGAIAALKRYVERGGGLLAIHSASASYFGHDEYYDILGGRFLHHGPIEEFTVRPTQADHPLASGISEFTVQDELYHHQYESSIEVLFDTDIDGESEPVVWRHRVGKGRVFYSALGHTTSSMRDPNVEKILHRGLDWVALDEEPIVK